MGLRLVRSFSYFAYKLWVILIHVIRRSFIHWIFVEVLSEKVNFPFTLRISDIDTTSVTIEIYRVFNVQYNTPSEKDL